MQKVRGCVGRGEESVKQQTPAELRKLHRAKTRALKKAHAREIRSMHTNESFLALQNQLALAQLRIENILLASAPDVVREVAKQLTAQVVAILEKERAEAAEERRRKRLAAVARGRKR